MNSLNSIAKQFSLISGKSLVIGFSLAIGLSLTTAQAKSKLGNDGKDSVAVQTTGDSEFVQAVKNHRNVNFVEGTDMLVAKILPEDHSGSPHQLWVVKLSNGESLQAVSNLDMCETIPLKVGDKVGLGGQFIWTQQGGLVHWLHKDPHGNRPDGYVNLDGKVYCQHP